MKNKMDKIMDKLDRIITEHKEELSNFKYDYLKFCTVLENVLKSVYKDEDFQITFLSAEKTFAPQDIMAIKFDLGSEEKMFGVGVLSLYRHYTSGVPFENVIKSANEFLLEEINSYQNQDTDTISIELTDIKNHLMLQLINTENNEEFVSVHPTRQFHDISIYCAIKADLQDGEVSLIPVSYEDMEAFGLDENSLFDYAEKNSIRMAMPIITPLFLAPEIYGDDAFVTDILTKEEYNQLKNEFCNEKAQPYLITSSLQMHSAFLFLYENILKGIAEKTETDLYIIPSSIHESIAFPVSEETSFEDILAMVITVNETRVPEHEILSDSIYYYSRKKGHITHYYKNPFVK